MKFTTSDLGTILRTELASASMTSVAVAFFNPDQTTFIALREVPNLRLVISDDFQINDPNKLEELHAGSTLRVIPSDARSGKLHSKVFLIHRKDGSRWAMIGSANFTWQGLFSNQEACIILDSVDRSDDRQLNEVETWFEHVLGHGHQIDFQVAKRIFETRARYRLNVPDYSPELSEESVVPRRYWVLKTTAGAYGDQYWPTFVSEDVIAVGWEDIEVDPSNSTDDELRQAVRDTYPHDDPGRAANKIRKFVNLREGDVVILCRGYPPNSSADVHVYGIARVAGPFLDDRESSWWRFKHPAVIQVIDENIPRDIMADALNKQSLMETIHKLEPEQFTVFARTLREHLGITVKL